MRICAEVVGRRSGLDDGIVNGVRSKAQPRDSLTLSELGGWLHAARKLVLSTELHVDGMRRGFPRGTLRASQLGCRLRCSATGSNLFSRKRLVLPLQLRSECHAGTQGASAKAISHIHGTGRHWRS